MSHNIRLARMPNTSLRLFAIELAESEKVVPYGVAKQTWSVFVEGRWMSAHRLESATVRRLPNARGSIWARTVELKLAAGTRLELSTESPRPRVRRDAFKVLTLDQASPVMVRKTPHIVTGDGRVERVTR